MVAGESTERGFALVLCLMVVLLVTSGLGAIATALSLQSQAVQRESRALRTRALADAALAETFAGLSRQRGFAGVNRHQLGGGWVSSRLERSGRTTTAEIVVAEITVELAGRETTVNARLQLRSGRPRLLAWGQGALDP